MFYLNKLRNRIHKLRYQNYLGGEGIEKQWNIFGYKFDYTLLPKCEKVCETFYKNNEVYLSITAVLQNEAPYIKEWIEYHRLVGVERFYIYDNESTDNVKEILKPYIDLGIVCYHYVPGIAIQNRVYRDALCKYKNQTRWMAIIDLDEFIVPVEKQSIPEFLKDYEKYPGVVINWQVFDSNGFLEPPKSSGGLVSVNYTRTYADNDSPINKHVKSIVNPRKVKSIVNPHFCYYKNQAYPVDENFQRVEGPFTKTHNSSKIKINHYHCKSKAEYMLKIDKWCADIKKKRVFDDRTINISEWKHDYEIQKFVPQLKNIMFGKTEKESA